MDAGCRLHFSSLRMRVPECRYLSLVIASEVIGREGQKQKKESKVQNLPPFLFISQL